MMDMEATFGLKGRVVVITGAGGGIGSAIARTLAGAGGHVACLDQMAPTALAHDIEANGGRAAALACDVTSETSVANAIASAANALGDVYGLVNGASNDDETSSVADMKIADWDRTFAVHVRGAFLVSRAVLPFMQRARSGSIVHIASQMGHVAAKGRAGYCSAKGALLQLAKAMALDLADQGIRVNSLSPGAVETRRMLLRHGDLEAARAYNAPKHALGRLGQPMEIASAALFLLSDASSFMTGADLLVDGGYNAM
jgi:NAD(P)-dependent dehydrogenase (short-subunit alcohol dehydrogenase family)